MALNVKRCALESLLAYRATFVPFALLPPETSTTNAPFKAEDSLNPPGT